MSLSRATLSKYNPLFTSLEPYGSQAQSLPKPSEWITFAFGVMLLSTLYQILKFYCFRNVPAWQLDAVSIGVATSIATVIRWMFLRTQAKLLNSRNAAETDLARERYILRAILDVLPEGIYVKDLQGKYCVINPPVVKFFGAKSEYEIVGKSDFDLYPRALAEKIQADDQLVIKTRLPLFNRDLRVPSRDGGARWLLVTKVPLINSNREVRGVVCTAVDITARKFTEEQLQKAKELAENQGRDLAALNETLKNEQAEREKVESELRLGQKLEAIGQLAAGIAHEINTPMQFIGDSVHFLHQSFDDLLKVLDAHLHGAPNDPASTDDGVDLDYIRVRVPRAIDRTLEGVERVTSLVRAMKDFSHPSSGEKTATDLNNALSNTLVVSRNEYKYIAQIETDFGNLPPVMCLPGEMNQVFLNLVVNAAHAIAAAVEGTGKMGIIRINTALEGDFVSIKVQDTGTGIPEEIRDRIFDPFFTTKPVGMGTGQGLAIARSIIVDKHGGTLTFETEVGRGTTFVIRIPVGEIAPAEEAVA